jgi:hypothetical protein
MAGLAEWQFEAGGWLQVNENRKLAGKSSLTLVETDIDERLKQLKQAGIEPRLVSKGEKVSVVIISDLDGNQIVLLREWIVSIYRRCNEPSVFVH